MKDFARARKALTRYSAAIDFDKLEASVKRFAEICEIPEEQRVLENSQSQEDESE